MQNLNRVWPIDQRVHFHATHCHGRQFCAWQGRLLGSVYKHWAVDISRAKYRGLRAVLPCPDIVWLVIQFLGLETNWRRSKSQWTHSIGARPHRLPWRIPSALPGWADGWLRDLLEKRGFFTGAPQNKDPPKRFQ